MAEAERELLKGQTMVAEGRNQIKIAISRIENGIPFKFPRDAQDREKTSIYKDTAREEWQEIFNTHKRPELQIPSSSYDQDKLQKRLKYADIMLRNVTQKLSPLMGKSNSFVLARSMTICAIIFKDYLFGGALDYDRAWPPVINDNPGTRSIKRPPSSGESERQLMLQGKTDSYAELPHAWKTSNCLPTPNSLTAATIHHRRKADSRLKPMAAEECS
ncbi:hypothetical protein MMC13_001002 [Lambiella insularis]|nr:hypothetical protein [Lambiella insularis]